MAQAQYPYLDLTVMPQMREHAVSPRAAVLFTPDLTTVLWSNGEGAQLIGAGSIRAALEGDYTTNTAMMRQISVAADKLDMMEEAEAAIRLKQGFQTKLLGFTVSRIALPGGDTATLLVSDNLHGRRHTHEAMAQTAVDALEGYSQAAVILDDNGDPMASSGKFDALDIKDADIAALIKEVTSEADRLVKRRVATASGDMPAGIARLADHPALYLLVIADAKAASAPKRAEKADQHESSQDEALEPAESDDENKSSAQDAAEEPPQAVAGQFSNRRERPGANRLNRWYYKKDPEPEPEQVEFLTYEDDTSFAEEPTASETDAPQETGESLKSVLQPVTLSTMAEPEQPLPEEMPPQDDPAASANGDEDFRFKASAKPVRFVWEMDDATTFVSISDELASAVGPKSAGVTGLTWQETGTSRGFANADEIDALLEKGDTWSGKTVLWPVQDTDLRVPVDLAGIPSFDRNRSFDGFSGFGIIRTADAMIDPEADGPNFTDDEIDDDFGPESAQAAAPKAEAEDVKIVDFGTRKPVRPDRELSSGEQHAFNEIAETLSDAQFEQPVKPKPVARSEAGTFTPSAFAKRVIEEHDAGPANAVGIGGANGKSKDDNQVDTSILAKLPIPVLVYRSNDMLFGNEEFFGLTGYADLSDLSKRGGVNALFGLRDGADDDGAIIYHRDGSQLNVRAHLQRVPWDQSRAMLLTLRRNGGGPGDRKPTPLLGDEDDTGPASQPSEAELTGGSEDLRPSISDTAPIALAVEDDVPAEDPPAVAETSPKEEAHIEQDETEASEKEAEVEKAKTEDAEKTVAAPELTPVVQKPSAPPPPSPTPSPPVAEVWIDQPSTAPSKAFGGLSGDDMRGILDVATDGIIILSDDGTVRAMNRSAEALFDMSAELVEDKSITRLLAPESHRTALDYLSGITGTGVASLLNDGREIIGKTAKGGLIPLFMTVGRLENSDACCAVVRDITHFKKAETDLVTAKAQAESANALKSDFLAKISHEIRTPLNAIIGFSDLMIEERFGRIDNDRYRGYLRDIRRSGNHVLDLINDLLDISKIEAGKVELEFDACELNTIVSDAVALIQPDANKQRIIIRTSLSAVVPKVVADPRSIRQIVLNIVSNAVKYTKQGGQVIVSTVYDENGEVILRIRDTGVGMSDLELARAMKPFQQVGPKSANRPEGTGLGLPLTKAMVEANRARFHIESVAGEGTMVEVNFPIQRVLADH